MSEEIKVTEGLNFGLGKLDSICQEMAENENYEPTPEEIEAQKEEIRKHEEKEKDERLRKSGIGERYFNSWFDNYLCNNAERKRVFNEVCNFIKDYQGKTLWMLGREGTGKTMLAAIICRECLGSHYVKSYQIAMELEDCMSFKATESRTALLQRYSKYPVLVIDEVGRFSGKEELKYLYMILNERYEMNLTTVLITNYEKSDFAQYLGKQLYDRFTENCKSIEFNFESYRMSKRLEYLKKE